jgi:Transcriptional regulatory protein, C terminal
VAVVIAILSRQQQVRVDSGLKPGLDRGKLMLGRSDRVQSGPAGQASGRGPNKNRRVDGVGAQGVHERQESFLVLSRIGPERKVGFALMPENVGDAIMRDEMLLDLAKGRSSAAFDRSIDVQISRLRRKIEADPREPAIIKTIRSGGYLFTSLVQAIRPTA